MITWFLPQKAQTWDFVRHQVSTQVVHPTHGSIGVAWLGWRQPDAPELWIVKPGHQPRIFIQSTTTQILNVHKTLKKKHFILMFVNICWCVSFRSSFYVLFPSLLRMAWLRPPPESTQRFVQGVQPRWPMVFPGGGVPPSKKAWLYIYIYDCIYIYIYDCIYIYMIVYIYINVIVYIYIWLYIYIYIYVIVCIYIYICDCIYIYNGKYN